MLDSVRAALAAMIPVCAAVALALSLSGTVAAQVGEPPVESEAAVVTDAMADAPGSDEASPEAPSDDIAADMAPGGSASDEAAGESASDEAASEEAGATAAPGRFKPLTDFVEAGGPIIIILTVLSVVGLALIVVKLVQFTLLRVGDHRFVERIWAEIRDGHPDDALAHVASRNGVVARVMETALRAKAIAGDTPSAREEVERVAKAKLDGLERGLPLLSLIATVSPLLGLLGTVLGMIEAFQRLETAGDRVDPAILSGGIWEALLTTAAGLSVAIPAAAFYTWLQRAVDVAGQHMEDAATRVFTANLYAKPNEAAPSEAVEPGSDQ